MSYTQFNRIGTCINCIISNDGYCAVEGKLEGAKFANLANKGHVTLLQTAFFLDHRSLTWASPRATEHSARHGH